MKLRNRVSKVHDRFVALALNTKNTAKRRIRQCTIPKNPFTLCPVVMRMAKQRELCALRQVSKKQNIQVVTSMAQP